MEAMKAELEMESLKRKVESLEWQLERSHLSQIATNKEQDRMQNEMEFYKKQLREAENELQGRNLTVIDKDDKFLDKLKSIEAQYLELKADKEAILKGHEEVIQQMEREFTEKLQKREEELEERQCKVEDLQMNFKTIPVPYQDADNVDSEDEETVGQSVEAIAACWNGVLTEPERMEAMKDELEMESLKRKVESLEWHLERSHSSQIAKNEERDRMHNDLEFYKKQLREAENELQGRNLTVIDKDDKFFDKLKSIEAQYLELKADKEAVLKSHEEVIQQMEREFTEKLRKREEELEERQCKVEDIQMNFKTIPVPYQDADSVDSEDEGTVEQSVEAIGACWNGLLETSQELESQTAPVTPKNSQVEREGVNIMAQTKFPKTLTRQKKKKRQAKLKFSKRNPKSRKTARPQKGDAEQTEAVAIPPSQLEMPSAIESTATTSSLVENHHPTELAQTAPQKRKRAKKSGFKGTAMASTHQMKKRRSMDSKQTDPPVVEQHATAYSETRNTSPPTPAQIMEVGPKPMAGHSRTFQTLNSSPIGSDSRFDCACGRYFATKYGLAIHVKQHTGRELLFKCPLPDCNQRFVSGHKMKQHMKKTHEVHDDVLKSYFVWCSICGRWFQSRAEWKQHQTVEGHYGQWPSRKLL